MKGGVLLMQSNGVFSHPASSIINPFRPNILISRGFPRLATVHTCFLCLPFDYVCSYQTL